MSSSNPVVDAVADAARRATRADAARVLTSGGAELHAAAVAGAMPGWRRGDAVPAESEGVGFVVASGQAFSVAAQGADSRPVLCVPCMHENELIGALELLGRPGEAAFPIEAMDVAMLFARVAGAAIAATDETAGEVPSPRELGAELARLDAADPARYAGVARAVSALLV